MTVMAELRKVSKSYGSGDGRVLALRNISLKFHTGQVTLVEGPSGGGKTTLLEILGLLLPPDEGQLLVAGRDYSACRETERTAGRREHVAFIFQDFNLLDSLSAKDNIGVVADMHQTDGAAVTRKILSQVGLENRSDHRPGMMSGGQKQRVSIGRALASQGKLVLADEPTANLDWSVGEPIVRILAEMAHEEGRCVVIVSHDARLEPFADRVVRLVDGQIAGEREVRPPVEAPEAPAARVPIQRHRVRAWGLWAAVILGVLLLVHQFGWYPWATTPTRAMEMIPKTVPGPPVVAAAPAVVEPASRVVQISSDRPGIIRRIAVRSGDAIAPGQILFKLDDEEATAQVELCEANVALAKAHLADLLAGTRPEKREEAEASLQAAQAVEVKAKFDYDRVQKLYQSNSSTIAEVQNMRAALDTALAEVRRAKAVVALAEAGPTATEVQEAQAQVAQAQAQLDAARASLQQRTIRSPIAGRVLYIYRSEGDVINFPTPTPVMSIGAAGNLRLRAEVDETDISRIRVGQAVLATSDSYPGRVFHGRVLYMENLMGKRSIHTDQPRLRQDVRVREIVIELDRHARNLPIDLLMTAQFLADSQPASGLAGSVTGEAPTTQP